MVSKGLLVRMEAKHGKESEVEALLSSALTLVGQETGTTAWFVIRFGRAEYGIFDAFPDEAAREAHLFGAVAEALFAQADLLFTKPPTIEKLDILANKLPVTPPNEPDTLGLLLSFKPHKGHEQLVKQFLLDAKALVDAEPDTTAWFAIHFENGEYGIFDVFPSQLGRFKHLTGHVPRELAKHALSLLGGLPDPKLPSVLAEKLG